MINPAKVKDNWEKLAIFSNESEDWQELSLCRKWNKGEYASMEVWEPK